MTPAQSFTLDCWTRAMQPKVVLQPTEWAERYVLLPGSARSERFRSDITPWTREPINRLADSRLRRMVVVKPVQSGGSVIGEVALCIWVDGLSGGDIQYNWQNDEQAESRWDTRIERILKACKPVMERWPQDRFKAMKGLVLFPHLNLTCQGVYTARNVASAAVRRQICEEVHDEEGWLPGRLEQAFGRLTAYWDGQSIVISNAGQKDGELHKVFLEGTQQHWEVPCPECGKWHAMRMRWDEKQPELGGLRYNADGCRLENGRYDYNKLAPTIRYQFPCGHEIADDIRARRKLSLAGRYGEPQNPGAPPGFPSFTYQAVSVDYIPWLDLVRQKHSAYRALKFGDPEPWKKYLRERECVFASDDERPLVGKVVVNAQLKKDRSGLANKVARFGAVDRQQGSLAKGEVPHWWLVIRDFDAGGNSLLVWEGKLLTDDDLVETLQRHEVLPRCVFIDSGDDTVHVYQFCLKHGYNALKGEKQGTYAHPDKSRRIFSPERPLHLMLGAPPSQPDPIDEPLFILYGKAGIRDRLHYLRGGGAVRWEVPADVSEDYKAHMESEELEQRKDQFGAVNNVWVQRRERNDLFVCECYAALAAEMAGLIGQIA